MRILRSLASILLLSVSCPLAADGLELPPLLERNGTFSALYRIDSPEGGEGALEVEWTDVLGRVVQRSATRVAANARVVTVPLDLSRAIAMRNTVRAQLVRGSKTTAATVDFIARSDPGAWDDFQIVMYQEHSDASLIGLRRLGVTAVKVLGYRVPFTATDVARRIDRPLQADVRWYVENIATDFYSAYHMWTPEHPLDVAWRFRELQDRHRDDAADLSVFERVPSLSDKQWIRRIRERLADTVRAHAPFRPLYYSLADEPGIADLAAAWDFDRSAAALVAFREWLRLRYGTLFALNQVWGAALESWDQVMPEGTTAAMQRTDDNYAAWNDFKMFMDESFASALRVGSAAVHAADPTALAGIEGGQIPGWGGWNYEQLAHAVDVMEVYEAGQNLEILRALNPDMILLSTTDDFGAVERQRLWRNILAGVRGLIIWDGADDVVRSDGEPGPRGAAEATFFQELRGGLGALLIASGPRFDPVAILYSPASFRVQWLLDHRAHRDAWTQRSSELENEDNVVRAAMRGAARDLAAAGIQPRWLTPELVAAGALRRLGVRVLILPKAIVLSDAEVAEISLFGAAGGVVLTDGEPGIYDGSSRLRAEPAFAPGILTWLPPTHSRGVVLAAALARAGVTPVALLPDTLTRGGTPIVTLRTNGEVKLLGIQPGDADAPAAEKSHELILAAPAFTRDVRTEEAWRYTVRPTIRIPRDGPALVAIAPGPLPDPTLVLPESVSLGETAVLQLGLAADTPAAATVLRVEVRDPAGRLVDWYSGNTVLRTRSVVWRIPFALNDPSGTWSVVVRDVLGGGAAAARLSVDAPRVERGRSESPKAFVVGAWHAVGESHLPRQFEP